MSERRNSFEYLESIGLREVSKPEIIKISDHFRSELLAGLRRSGSSIGMFPSMLKPAPFNLLPEGAEALVLEVGGTNVYGARVLVEKGKPKLTIGTKDVLPTRKFKSADDFFRQITKTLEPVIRGGRQDAIGFVYSFPGTPFLAPTGVDVISAESLPKEFEIPGISTIGVGEALRQELNKQFEIPTNTRTVVLNDTVAVLFSAEAQVGGVVASGFNLSMTTPEGVTNSECGGFAINVSHPIADIIDAKSSNPGLQLAEKQVSGLYLSAQLEEAMRQLSGRGFDMPELGDITGETLSKLIIADNKKDVLTEVARRLSRRSAQIVGTLVGTSISTFQDKDASSQVNVPIEGSLFWGIPGYGEIAANVASEVSGKKVEFIFIENSGRIGAAVAALSHVG